MYDWRLTVIERLTSHTVAGLTVLLSSDVTLPMMIEVHKVILLARPCISWSLVKKKEKVAQICIYSSMFLGGCCLNKSILKLSTSLTKEKARTATGCMYD